MYVKFVAYLIAIVATFDIRFLHTAIEGFFDIQPYKAYRNYLNVYIVMAESGESQLENGVHKDTKFSTYYYRSDGTRQGSSDYDLCFTYAQKAPIGDINNTVVVLVVNTQEVNSGWCAGFKTKTIPHTNHKLQRCE